MHWQPTATIETLQARAQFLREIRDFFAARGVWEVDVPVLSKGVATDPKLQAFVLQDFPYYLQTSPEYAMKRLLASGSGPIYSLGKAFRQEEVGRLHNPEFTMLEWYRPGWNHLQLIEEVQALVQQVLNCEAPQVVTYQSLFENAFNINPHLASLDELKAIAIEKGWVDEKADYDKEIFLDLLLSHGIEPLLDNVVVTDYPGFQASLSKMRHIDGLYAVAERFEYYIQGIELANGYHELTCAKEQRTRFERDLTIRKEKALTTLPVDENLLAALAYGMPESAGVALGVDRLFLLQQQQKHIKEVIPFTWENA